MMVRPRIPLGQKILGALIVICLITVAGSTIYIGRAGVNEAKDRISLGSPSAGNSITVREYLVFLVRLEQWSVGLKERRDVQIARGILT